MREKGAKLIMGCGGVLHKRMHKAARDGNHLRLSAFKACLADASVGLVREPFVSGADTWIDRVSLLTSPTPRMDSRLCSIGGAQTVVEIGITRQTWT